MQEFQLTLKQLAYQPYTSEKSLHLNKQLYSHFILNSYFRLQIQFHLVHFRVINLEYIYKSKAQKWLKFLKIGTQCVHVAS